MPPRPRISPLEAHLGYWLRYVSNQVSHAFAARLAARGVTVAEWVMLRDLYETDGAMASAVADRLGMTRGAISKLTDRLEQKGLLKRAAHAEDRRARTLSLTAKGARLTPELAALADRNDEDFFGPLDARTRDAIASAMKEIVRRQGLRTVPVD